MLKIKKLFKVFYPNTINENKIFNGLSLEVKEKDFITILGSNGAGKSTLLIMISGTLSCDYVCILIDGDDVTDLEEFKRSKDIGRVYHNPS